VYISLTTHPHTHLLPNHPPQEPKNIREALHNFHKDGSSRKGNTLMKKMNQVKKVTVVVDELKTSFLHTFKVMDEYADFMKDEQRFNNFLWAHDLHKQYEDFKVRVS